MPNPEALHSLKSIIIAGVVWLKLYTHPAWPLSEVLWGRVSDSNTIVLHVNSQNMIIKEWSWSLAKCLIIANLLVPKTSGARLTFSAVPTHGAFFLKIKKMIKPYCTATITVNHDQIITIPWKTTYLFIYFLDIYKRVYLFILSCVLYLVFMYKMSTKISSFSRTELWDNSN